mmetsp:Transcript_10788/g.31942  ORF Transcript_10788/g.31942 Transcript_10788/m.31942 type:complete len:220 (+) Transcript_10788:305-964(+)
MFWFAAGEAVAERTRSRNAAAAPALALPCPFVVKPLGLGRFPGRSVDPAAGSGRDGKFDVVVVPFSSTLLGFSTSASGWHWGRGLVVFTAPASPATKDPDASVGDISVGIPSARAVASTASTPPAYPVGSVGASEAAAGGAVTMVASTGLPAATFSYFSSTSAPLSAPSSLLLLLLFLPTEGVDLRLPATGATFDASSSPSSAGRGLFRLLVAVINAIR